MSFRPHRVLLRSLLLLLCAASVGSCVIGEGLEPVPSDSATLQVELDPGESQTYEFLVEAETFGSNETFQIRLSPTAASLSEQRVMTEQSWTRGNDTQSGWPEYVDLDADENMQGVLSLSLTNTDEANVAEFDVRVEVDGGGQAPEPGPEDLRLDIRMH
jgi:hypothetical protein